MVVAEPPFTVMVISSKLLQKPEDNVQRKTFVPFDKPETEEVGLFAFAKFPVPVITVHVPVVQVVATFAVKFVLVEHIV